MAKYVTQATVQELVNRTKEELNTKLNLTGSEAMTGRLKMPEIELASNATGTASNLIEIGDGKSGTKGNVFAVDNTGVMTAGGDIALDDGTTLKSIKTKIGSAYIHKGTVTFPNLPTTLNASKIGWVYNVTNSKTVDGVTSEDYFTIDSRFVEYESGKTKYYPSGTDVVIVEVTAPVEADPEADPPVEAVPGVYKYDVLPGFVDIEAIRDSIEATDADDIDDFFDGKKKDEVEEHPADPEDSESVYSLGLVWDPIHLYKDKYPDTCEIVWDDEDLIDAIDWTKYVSTSDCVVTYGALGAPGTNYSYRYDTTSHSMFLKCLTASHIGPANMEIKLALKTGSDVLLKFQMELNEAAASPGGGGDEPGGGESGGGSDPDPSGP